MMYVTDPGEKVIKSFYMGTSQWWETEEVLVSGLGSPMHIILDPTKNYLYWTDSCFNKIMSAKVDGTCVEDVLTNVEPMSLALTIPLTTTTTTTTTTTSTTNTYECQCPSAYTTTSTTNTTTTTSTTSTSTTTTSTTS